MVVFRPSPKEGLRLGAERSPALAKGRLERGTQIYGFVSAYYAWPGHPAPGQPHPYQCTPIPKWSTFVKVTSVMPGMVVATVQ